MDREKKMMGRRSEGYIICKRCKEDEGSLRRDELLRIIGLKFDEGDKRGKGKEMREINVCDKK